MTALAIQRSVVFEDCECINCGVVFAFTKYFYDERRKDHRNFFCPNGHQQHYTSESDAEKNARLLREEQQRHQRTLSRANEAEAEAARLKKRINNGTCPCCKRTFKQLSAHMKSKHPDYSTTKAKGK